MNKEFSPHSRIRRRVIGILILILVLASAGFVSAKQEITVMINKDGQIVKETISAHPLTSIDKALKENGYDIDGVYQTKSDVTKKLYDTDIVTLNKSYDGEILVDNQRITYTTTAKTVGDVLSENNVVVSDEDQITPSLTTALTDSVKQIRVTRVESKQVTEMVALSYDTKRIESDELDKGIEETTTLGADGVKEQVYKVTIVEGKEMSRDLISENITVEPKTEVIVVGTKEAAITKPAEKEPETSEPVEEPKKEVKEENTTSNEQQKQSAQEDPVQEEKKQEDTSSAPANTATVSNETPQDIAKRLLAERGWSDQWNSLNSLVQRESSWNVYAENPYSGAYGIPQALPGYKMSAFGDDWQTNPETQLRWMLSYIEGRYGDPNGAWAAFQSKGWY